MAQWERDVAIKMDQDHMKVRQQLYQLLGAAKTVVGLAKNMKMEYPQLEKAIAAAEGTEQDIRFLAREALPDYICDECRGILENNDPPKWVYDNRDVCRCEEKDG